MKRLAYSFGGTMPLTPHLDPDHALAPAPVPKELPSVLHSQFPLLVAIAGDDCTSSTVHVAEALAATRGAAPALLYVMELTPVATIDGGIGTAVLTQLLLDPEQHAKDERALRASCHVDTGIPATWPFTLDLGNATSSIAVHAERIGAHLITMGLHRHGVVDHALAADTVRNVVGTSAIPVLAVRPGLDALPKTIVVAIDFSVASLRAARLARELLADDGTLHLVFVESVEPNMVNESEQGRRLIEANGVDAAFAQLRTVLDPAPQMTVKSTIRFGHPVDELKAICEAVHPDVVAIGSQRHPFLKRLFVGTVTNAMMNDARWSMLITPPMAH